MSDETFMYPVHIAEELGMSTNEINALKKKGCPFKGRKTSVRLVRSFLYASMGVESASGLLVRPQHSNGKDER